MHTKTMEGLIGARTNMELLNTPFRVYKEARLKGDTAMMERAMGYVGDFQEDAYEYKAEADEGMKKDAEETRRIAEEQQKELIQSRREEREEQQKKIEEERKEKQSDQAVDTVEISEEGRALLKVNAAAAEETDVEAEVSSTSKEDSEPIFYAGTGEIKQTEDTGTNMSVSV
ncbi:MAG: hypothetical protein NC302_11585 [Bacteroidales bacterium]|nr:hypothetical protein [Bacteroidales bacterium]MCM1416769.1 hypothetical protein [bacterium]MCM1424733.1 hypothetical protein [bacterium]